MPGDRDQRARSCFGFGAAGRNSRVSGTPSKSKPVRRVFSMKRLYDAGTMSGSLHEKMKSGGWAATCVQ